MPNADDPVISALLQRFAATHALQQTQLLPLLQAVQAQCGSIDDAALQQLAHALNLSRAEVFGVASFYSDLRREPSATPRFEVCAAEACQARGAAELLRAHGADTRVHEVFCLGNCARGPTVRQGNTLFGDVSVEQLHALLDGRSAP